MLLGQPDQGRGSPRARRGTLEVGESLRPPAPEAAELSAIVLLSVAAGCALAISVAKAGAPKQTVYELPLRLHDQRADVSAGEAADHSHRLMALLSRLSLLLPDPS